MASKGKKPRLMRRGETIEPTAKTSLVSKIASDILFPITNFQFGTGPIKATKERLEYEINRAFTINGGQESDLKEIGKLGNASDLEIFLELVGHDYRPFKEKLKTKNIKELFYLVRNALGNDEVASNILTLAKELNDPELENAVEKTNLLKKIGTELEQITRPNANVQEIIGELRNFVRRIPKQPSSTQTKELGLQDKTESMTATMGGNVQVVPPGSGSSVVPEMSEFDVFNIFEGTFSQKKNPPSAGPPPASSSSYSTFDSAKTAIQFPLSMTSQGSIGYVRSASSSSGIPTPQPFSYASSVPTPQPFSYASSVPTPQPFSYRSQPPSYASAPPYSSRPQPGPISSATYSNGPSLAQIINMEAQLTNANIKDNLDQEIARRLLDKTPYIYDAFEIPDQMYDDLVATRNKAYYMVNVSQLEQDRKNRMNQEIQNRATLQKEYDLRFVTPLCPENHGPKSFVK